MKATICDRCGKTVKDSEVADLAISLDRPGFSESRVNGAELCPECAEVIEKVIETRVQLKESNPAIIIIGKALKPAQAPKVPGTVTAPKPE